MGSVVVIFTAPSGAGSGVVFSAWSAQCGRRVRCEVGG